MSDAIIIGSAVVVVASAGVVVVVSRRTMLLNKRTRALDRMTKCIWDNTDAICDEIKRLNAISRLYADDARLIRSRGRGAFSDGFRGLERHEKTWDAINTERARIDAALAELEGGDS